MEAEVQCIIDRSTIAGHAYPYLNRMRTKCRSIHGLRESIRSACLRSYRRDRFIDHRSAIELIVHANIAGGRIDTIKHIDRKRSGTCKITTNGGRRCNCAEAYISSDQVYSYVVECNAITIVIAGYCR